MQAAEYIRCATLSDMSPAHMQKDLPELMLMDPMSGIAFASREHTPA